MIALLLHAVHPYHLTAISQSALARGVVLISCRSGTYSVVALRCSLVYTRPSLLLGGALFGLCVGGFPPRAWLLGAPDAITGSSGAFLHFNCPFYPTNIVLNDVICLPVENGDCGCYETPCSDDVCILNEWVCDGLPDCSDGGDEDDCGTSCDVSCG